MSMSFNKVISDTSMRLGPVRFSYCYVFRPRNNQDGTPGKYGVCVIFPKSDTETYNMFKRGYENACALGKTNKWNGRIPPKVQLPLHDGDDERPDDPAFKGCWFFNCSSVNKPGVRVMEAGIISEPLEESEFYSGCYGAITINMFPYSNNGNVGVGIGLNNLVKTQDGEPLGGGRSAEADFGDMV